jgi:hypothetical protein
LLSGDMTRGERFGLLGAPGGAGGSVSRARAINRHELRGNEAGQAAPQRYAHDAHDDHGGADRAREAEPSGAGAANPGRAVGGAAGYSFC